MSLALGQASQLGGGVEMTNKKLQEAGRELGISEKDITRIRRQRLKTRLFYPIIGAIIVACFSGLGYVAKDAFVSPDYPYAAPGLALVTGPEERKGGFKSFTFILLTTLLSIVGFLAVYKVGHPHGAAAPAYHVFSRQR
jgi:hypothetical protein